jgi:hypothetical protein
MIISKTQRNKCALKDNDANTTSHAKRRTDEHYDVPCIT